MLSQNYAMLTLVLRLVRVVGVLHQEQPPGNQHKYKYQSNRKQSVSFRATRSWQKVRQSDEAKTCRSDECGHHHALCTDLLSGSWQNPMYSLAIISKEGYSVNEIEDGASNDDTIADLKIHDLSCQYLKSDNRSQYGRTLKRQSNHVPWRL